MGKRIENVEKLSEKYQVRRLTEADVNMLFKNVYFINGTAYAGKSTMVKLLAEKHCGILCEENYHDRFFPEPDKNDFPYLQYTKELKDWHDFIQ